jgi:hypothetical protein
MDKLQTWQKKRLGPSSGHFDCVPQEQLVCLIDAADCKRAPYWPIVLLPLVSRDLRVTFSTHLFKATVTVVQIFSSTNNAL